MRKSPFSIVGPATFNLGAGLHTTVTVRFSPTAVGSARATVAFSSNGGNFERTVSGRGADEPAIDLQVTPLFRDFDEVPLGQSQDLTFTVANTGGATLRGSATVPAPFRIVSGSPFSLRAGENTTVTVRFTPTVTDPVRRIVIFTSNVGSLGREVSGRGVDDPTPAISARIDRHSVYPRAVSIGEAVTIGFAFTNTGTEERTFGARAFLIKPDGEAYFFLAPGGVTLAPGKQGSAQWTHTIDMVGMWNIIFGAWENPAHPLGRLLDQTGQVEEFILASLGPEHNSPPQADFTLEENGLTVHFFCTSTDLDDNIISRRWKFGDGRTSWKKNPIHTYRGLKGKAVCKFFTVVLTVEDFYGRSSSIETRVMVFSRIGCILYPSAVIQGSTLRVRVIAYGDLVTVSLGGIEIKRGPAVLLPLFFSFDTSGLNMGEQYELIVDVDGEIYRTFVSILCPREARVKAIKGRTEGLDYSCRGRDAGDIKDTRRRPGRHYP